VNPFFNINFRREAYLQEMAKARRRVIALGVWIAYFGLLGVLLGLYGLNCSSLARRTQADTIRAYSASRRSASAGWPAAA